MPAEKVCAAGIAEERRPRISLAFAGPRKQNSELLPAVTGDEVGGSQHRAPCHAHVAQQRVASGVAVRVVVGLEAIEIE